MTFFLCPDNCLILRLRSWKNRPFICKWSRGNSMQNADTTQFFWGGSSIVYLYYYNTEIVSSPSSSRSSSTLNFPFRVDTFFVVFLCHLDFRFVRFFRRFLAGNEQVVRIREGAEAYPNFYECFSIFQKKRPQITIMIFFSQ